MYRAKAGGENSPQISQKSPVCQEHPLCLNQSFSENLLSKQSSFILIHNRVSQITETVSKRHDRTAKPPLGSLNKGEGGACFRRNGRVESHFAPAADLTLP